MTAKRLSMHKIREILRLKWQEGLSHRDTARSLGLGLGTVGDLMVRAQRQQLNWEEVEAISDSALTQKLYPASTQNERPAPDLNLIHRDLRRPGVTLELLHLEYLDRNPNGLRYTAFCARYRKWKKQQRLSMRQVHRGGEKVFIDYSGKKPSIVDAKTGEVVEVELFVAVFGASSFTYVEATRTQKVADWIGSHVRALKYFSGAPQLLVPDQLKSGVTTPCRYEPATQRTYAELARHFGTAVLPARPKKPKDKAKVERAVQLSQRWILACIRNELFYSLAHLNLRIRELLERFNDKKMPTYGDLSRREMFARYDKPYLKPLPEHDFEYAEWKKVKVSIDYHVEFDGHFYSVPYPLVGQYLEARTTQTTIELYHGQKRIAAHPRSLNKGLATTIAAHMPKTHRAHLEWSPTRFIKWGASIGPSTEVLITNILNSRPHPEMGYRSCLGILNLAKRYDKQRLENAARKSNAVNATSYRHVAAILKKGLDRLPEPESKQSELPLIHENLRGSGYYN